MDTGGTLGAIKRSELETTLDDLTGTVYRIEAALQLPGFPKEETTLSSGGRVSDIIERVNRARSRLQRCAEELERL